MKNQSAFTFVEIMMVVIIIGIIAMFVVPGYEKAQDRALEQKGYANLLQIYSAQKLYYSKHSEYWGPGNSAAINSIDEQALGLSLPDDELSYYCRGCDNACFGGDCCQNFFCFAERDHADNTRDFTLRVDAIRLRNEKEGCDGTTYKLKCNPGCAAGNCPTLDASRTDYNVYDRAAWNS